MPCARTVVHSPTSAEVLLEEGGRWRRVVLVEGLDAEPRALELRRLLESGLVAPGAVALADPAPPTPARRLRLHEAERLVAAADELLGGAL
jgi:hypothetical protein